VNEGENVFGLTRREQRWKAEQQAAEVLATLVGTALQAAAQVRVSEAQTDAAELARLRKEADSFHMAYRLKCDEETKAQALEIDRLRAELADAKHAMRAYAEDNPRHEYEGRTQDPNGAHAWLARNDKA
jgi:hypothetical protein